MSANPGTHHQVDDELEKAFNVFWIRLFIASTNPGDQHASADLEAAQKVKNSFLDRFSQALNVQSNNLSTNSPRIKRLGELASAMNLLNTCVINGDETSAIREAQKKLASEADLQTAWLAEMNETCASMLDRLDRISGSCKRQEKMFRSLNLGRNSPNDMLAITDPPNLGNNPWLRTDEDLPQNEKINGDRDKAGASNEDRPSTPRSELSSKGKARAHRSSVADVRASYIPKERLSLKTKSASTPRANLTIDDPFAFDATIIYIPKDSARTSKIPCRGKMDTGSRDNWVSRRVIASTHLEYAIEDLAEPRAYSAFGGDVFFPIGQVEIKWYLQGDSQRTLTSLFLVGDEVPFDMVVGSVLIQQEDLLMRKEAALGVRVVEPTEDELARMEIEAKTGARSRQQLAAIQTARKARAKAQRESARQLNVTPAELDSGAASLADSTSGGQTTSQSS